MLASWTQTWYTNLIYPLVHILDAETTNPAIHTSANLAQHYYLSPRTSPAETMHAPLPLIS